MDLSNPKSDLRLMNTNYIDIVDSRSISRKTEDSSSSRLKILNRGDILGAMNCIFPDMQLVHPESTKKAPDPDHQEFSLFSESHNELLDIFASAKNFRNEVSMDFASRKRSLQQTLSNMIHEETESQSQSKSINSTTNGDGGQPQAKAILKPRYTVNLLDTDYQRFVDDLLAEQYAPRCTDFRTVEEIIAFLDHKSVEAETSTARHIAPFNSNLPVLNISKCEAPNPSLPSSINPHVKGAQSKLYSSLLKSSTNDSSPLLCVGSNISTRKSATGTPRRVPKKSEEGRALMAIEKSTGRKQSKNKRGRRSNRPKESLSGDSVLNKEDSIEGVPKMAYKARAPPLLETPTNIPGPTAHHAVPRSHPINNHQDDELRQLNDRIERDMLNLLLNVDESVTVASAPPPVAMPVASNIAAPAPRPVSSQEIFLMNLKTLQQQTSTKEQQQRLADEQQRVMTTLFLRQHFSATKLTQHPQNTPTQSYQHPNYNQIAAQPSIPSPSAPADPVAVSMSRLPCLESSSSIGDLEQQALNQYRTSDESMMDAEFTRLEREAQEQYPY